MENNSLEVINAAIQKLLLSYSLEELCTITVEEVQKMIRAEYGAMYLQEKGKLEMKYASSFFLTKVKVKKKGSLDKASRSSNITVLPLHEIRQFLPGLEEHGIKSVVIIPLSYHAKAIGLLVLCLVKDKRLTDKEMQVLKLYGSIATLAITKTKLHEEFILFASHELRTPLTSINGYIQLLCSKLAKKDTVESQWVKELYHESERLTKLVKDLLDIKDINKIKQQMK